MLRDDMLFESDVLFDEPDGEDECAICGCSCLGHLCLDCCGDADAHLKNIEEQVTKELSGDICYGGEE